MRASLARSILALAIALLPAATALAAGTEIVVYVKGQTLRYDPDVGAELKEVFLETWDCAAGKLTKKETIEAYFHLSDDKEIITPDAICDECRRKFLVEKKNEKYFFGGVRDKAATKEEADAAAPAPAPGEGVRSLESKVKRISAEIVKIEAEKRGSSTKRDKLITAEFTTSFQNFTEQDLEQVAGYVLEDPALNTNQRYYVLRSFGYTFFKRKDFPKAVFFYDKCTSLAPGMYSGHYQKAVALQESGEGEKAVRSYGKALAAKPVKSVVDALQKYLGTLEATGRLTDERLSEVKEKAGAIASALRGKDAQKASDAARSLDAKLEEWLGSGADPGATAGGPPSPPPDAPPSAPPSSPPPEDATPGGNEGDLIPPG